jgi:hypothetical protein
MAERLKEVRSVMRLAIKTIMRVFNKPTCPRTQPNLKYIITPSMVRIVGVKTPRNVPKFPGFEAVGHLERAVLPKVVLGMQNLYRRVCLSYRKFKKKKGRPESRPCKVAHYFVD